MRIQLLTHPRSGSTYYAGLLERYIREYPNFEIQYEPFNIDWITTREKIEHHNFPKYAEDRVEAFSKTAHCLVKNHMFNMFHLHSMKNNLWDRYMSLNWHTVVLVRKNVFDTVMSLALARTKDVWFYDKDAMVDKKSIPLDIFHRTMLDCLNNYRKFRSNELGIVYNQVIYYEDLTSNPIEDVKKSGFIPTYINGMESQVHRGPSKESSIANIDQLKSYFTNFIRANKIKIVTPDGFLDEEFSDYERFIPT
jgi:hypothetical protein